MAEVRKGKGFDTIAIHGGHDPDPTTLSRAVPIYRTTSYVFRDSTHAADMFALREIGNIYTRLMNPTTDVLEQRLALLEEGGGGLALASGTSAVLYSLITFMEAGDEFISASNLYGGTYTMFNDILPQFGIKARFVDPADTQAFREALTEKTRAVFLESIGNPKLGIPDFHAISEIAQSAHIPLIVDSTFTTPYLFRPIEHGADIVVHSLTKWIGGHGTAVGGIVVDSGKFDWTDPKFRLFSEPEPSYFGIRFGHDLGALQPLAYILRMRLVPLRNLGACVSPDNAWMFLQGLETLSLRMERHCSNALAVARFLEAHEKVEWVRYPGLETDPLLCARATVFSRRHGRRHRGVRNQRRLRRGQELYQPSRAVLSSCQRGGRQESRHSSGEHDPLATDPRNSNWPRGVSPDLIRLSVGIEDVHDIIADLERALAAA